MEGVGVGVGGAAGVGLGGAVGELVDVHIEGRTGRAIVGG